MTTIQEAATVGAVDDRHRYPGVRAFQEPDAGRFFGRHRAAQELLLRVLSVRLLLQFAPSGAGKTSLLNAGLFPRLRPHGYLPVNVRLNHPQETLVEAVTRSLSDAAVRSGLKDPVIPQSARGVWELLSGVQLWGPGLVLLMPVLVFDQFEEVFTLRDEAFRKRFAEQIGALSQGRHSTANIDDPRAVAPEVKIIISLREEYLGALEEMAADIPDLFRERLRLAPLTSEEAKEAIVEPARLEGDWSSPPFEFDGACLAGLIEFIDGVSDRIHLIEPLTLQLVCQRAEAIAATRASDRAPLTLVLDDFGGPSGLESLVHNYYTSELAKLPGRSTRRSAARMFEQGLLDPSGKRLMLEQDEIQRQYGLGTEVVGALVESRLLRREPRNESVFYEISHDRLTDVIARHRSSRLPKWVRPVFAVAASLIVVLTAALFFIIAAKNEAEDAEQRTARALNVLLGDALGLRLREAGLSDALEKTVGTMDPREGSDLIAQVRQLRRLGELARERDTLAIASDKLTAALHSIDQATAAGDNGAAMRTERAQVLKDLGDVLLDKGEISAAERHYSEAVDTWKTVAGSERDPTTELKDIDAQNSLGGIWERLGDEARADTLYADAARRAVDVVKGAYQKSQDQATDGVFELGLAMQFYVDATLSLASLSSDLDDFKSARALAAHLMVLRPMSAQARIELGTVSANYAAAIAGGDDWQPARRLFDESHRQFRDVTQFDPRNRRMYREMTAARLVMANGIGRCAENPACRKALRPGELESAEHVALESIGRFQELSNGDPENRSLRDDIAWGMETQAALARTRGARGAVLPPLESALTIRRSNIVDDRDVTNRSTLISVMQIKARALAETGRRDEALKLLEESFASASQLPEGNSRVSRRIDGLYIKAQVLTDMGRKEEARAAANEETRLLNAFVAANAARKKNGKALNEEGNELYKQASNQKDAEKSRAFDRAAEKYRAALANRPGDRIIWGNLRSTCARAAEPLTDATGDALTADAATKQHAESELRCALESAWLAWVLSDDGTGSSRADSLKTLYEERRSLARLLRNDEDHLAEARALAEQGVREAEELHAIGQTAETLSLVADSYFGLAMMREESHSEGWEEMMRVAILGGERVREKEPTVARHMTWLGQVRTELAARLDAWKRPGAAEQRKLALQMCQNALRNAKTDGDRAAARACLDALQN